MDRAIFIAMSGAREALRRHAAETHNLANRQTVGFRADMVQALSVPVHGPGYADRVYAQQASTPIPDLSSGPVVTTGRDLDVAVQGPGFIVVQAPDGGEALSRAGDLEVGPTGLLTDSRGRAVMGESGPIALPPYDRIEIGADGTISLRSPGQSDGPLAVVDRILLAKPDPAELIRAGDGSIRRRDGAAVAADGSVRLVSGALEMSNVKPVESMVRMIELQRQFETHVKMMKITEENDRAAARLLRLR